MDTVEHDDRVPGGVEGEISREHERSPVTLTVLTEVSDDPNLRVEDPVLLWRADRYDSVLEVQHQALVLARHTDHAVLAEQRRATGMAAKGFECGERVGPPVLIARPVEHRERERCEEQRVKIEGVGRAD